MDKKLNILFVVSESTPYAKSGGLADVAASLPLALAKRGHKVMVVMPYYASIAPDLVRSEETPFSMNVWMGDCEEWCLVHPKGINKNLNYYFIDFQKYFFREGYYHNNAMQDYPDNPSRFAFLSQAALYLCKTKQIRVDVVHAHDWQTSAAMAYLKTHHQNCAFLGHAAGMLTIHNIGYQGKYPRDSYSYLGFREQDFNPRIFEDYGDINLLKGGIHFADIVNTVSPSYANETLNPAFSYGLDPFLRLKGDRYIGILNGADYEEWDPAADPLIVKKYGIKNMNGKAACKLALQQRMNLYQQEYIPIIGMVSRMAEQKGHYQLRECIEAIVNNMQVQFAILGSGDKELEHYFGALPEKYPGLIGAYIGYDNALAHQIEAGSDFFLMPSLYEPCGLNQIYSLRYGTLPIVRATGGLDDTVEQYVESDGSGTGFKYYDATPRAIYDTVGWAVSTYYDRREHYAAMQRRAMKQNFSWEESTNLYETVYQRAIKVANREN
ncbi:MAG: glycogen synthase [Candidatus Neomarinimicrobiota bacterium]|nr:glycogen synthase [Candidatus Neomarinimicrobiota bacterium]MDX9779891.1 glycogen synthase [bacterium]